MGVPDILFSKRKVVRLTQKYNDICLSGRLSEITPFCKVVKLSDEIFLANSHCNNIQKSLTLSRRVQC